MDTSLSNASVNQEMSYTVTIYTLTATTAGSDSNVNGQDNPAHSLNPVKTGDGTPIILWVAVLAVSAGVLFWLFLVKKRKNDRKNEQNESEQRKKQ